MSTSDLAIGTPATTSFRRLCARVATRAAAALDAWRRRAAIRRSTAALKRVDDATLRDLGLHRSGARAAVTEAGDARVERRGSTGSGRQPAPARKQ